MVPRNGPSLSIGARGAFAGAAAPRRVYLLGAMSHRPPNAAPPASPLDCLDAVYVAEARPGQELPTPGEPEVAFAGRSNVGKSTLLNRLCQRKSLARTSRTPGCTRGVVLFRCLLRDDTRFVVADLPGYGFAERSKAERDAWRTLIEGYLQRRASLAGVVVLVDGRRGVQPEEAQLAEYLRHINRRYFIVVTKVDKLARAERGKVVASIHRTFDVPVVGASGETGEGREEVLRRIRGLVRFDAAPSQSGTPPEAPTNTLPSGADV